MSGKKGLRMRLYTWRKLGSINTGTFISIVPLDGAMQSHRVPIFMGYHTTTLKCKWSLSDVPTKLPLE